MRDEGGGAARVIICRMYICLCRDDKKHPFSVGWNSPVLEPHRRSVRVVLIDSGFLRFPRI